MPRRKDKTLIEARNMKSQVVRARIVAHIEKNGPATNLELQAAIGRSPSTVYHHILMMSRIGLVHNQPIYNNKNGTDEAMWHLGENPNKSGDPEVVQRRVKVWPLHHVRDSLVSALFGSAGVLA